MNYEERYNKLIEAIKVLQETNPSDEGIQNWVHDNVPELVESEDEKIRNELIEQVAYIIPNNDEVDDEGEALPTYQKRIDKYRAWLEKQGEKKQVEHLELKAGHWYICHRPYCCRADSLTVKEGERFKCEKDGVVKGFVIKEPEKYFREISAPAFMEDELNDEVRRRSTIQVLEYARSLDTYNQYGKEDISKNIAWLEKQKDNIKLSNSAYTSNKDVIEFADKYSHTIWENLMDNFKKIENYSIGCNDVSDIVLNAIINTYNWLEKQDENKHDKNKPKFKVGDWVITPKNIVLQITNIKGTRYAFNNSSHYWEIYYCDKECRLWTIQDAQDGDVLYSLDSKQPFIYKERPQFSQARGYCCINEFGEFAVWNTIKCVICTDKYIPATKEQRDLLFREMKEAGYVWDGDTKELKKIEPKFHPGDWIIDKSGFAQQVLDFSGGIYTCTYNSFTTDCESNYHLWSIQDAKDGDVLVRNNDILSICIFSHFSGIHNKFGFFLCHCGLECEGLDQELSINGYYDNSENYVLANKEQRDLLFRKIKEAGYEWNSEKKELKKTI